MDSSRRTERLRCFAAGRRALSSALLAGFVALGCSRDEPAKPAPAPEPAPTVAPATECSTKAGVIASDTTFSLACSPYNLTDGIDVINGATLTIEAGVEVRFRGGDWLEIGATGRPGRLVARGTAERPIVIAAAEPPNPQARPWFGVWFHGGTLEGSVLSHAIIQKGGGTNAFFNPPLEQGCLTFTGVHPGALRVEDVRLRDCPNGGLRLTASEPRLARLTLEKTELGAVSDAGSFGSFTDALTADAPVVLRVEGGEVTRDARWEAQRGPVSLEADVVIAGPSAPTLTLAPGLVLSFEKNARLRVGVGAKGSLVALPSSATKLAHGAARAGARWPGIERGPLAERLVLP